MNVAWVYPFHPRPNRKERLPEKVIIDEVGMLVEPSLHTGVFRIVRRRSRGIINAAAAAAAAAAVSILHLLQHILARHTALGSLYPLYAGGRRLRRHPRLLDAPQVQACIFVIFHALITFNDLANAVNQSNNHISHTTDESPQDSTFHNIILQIEYLHDPYCIYLISRNFIDRFCDKQILLVAKTDIFFVSRVQNIRSQNIRVENNERRIIA